MIQLFACDLDGTLLNEKHEFDEIIFDSIDEVIKNEKYFTIATGRHMFNSHRKRMKLDNKKIYKICMNGAMIYDVDGNILYKKTLNKEILKEFLIEFPEVNFECIGIDQVYIQNSKEKYIEDVLKRSNKSTAFKESYLYEFIKDCAFNQSIEDIISHDIFKCNFIVQDEKIKERLNEKINYYRNEIVNAPFEKDFYELTDATVNKQAAVSKLAAKLNIDEDEVAVYGDGGNDLEMLSHFKYSYATSNASNDAKKAANFMIGDCKDHAVSHHIKLTLISEKNNEKM